MTWPVVVAAAGAAVVTTLVRYLGLNGFSNDHFLYLAGAQQMLMGEWPIRDFADPGMPLMYAASAGAQLLLGRSLFAEAIMVTVAYGLASAGMVVAAWRASRSLVVAVIACALCVAAFPRLYGYPKALLYVLGPLAMWAWARQPGVRRLLIVAALVGVAFLFRHDHGVYLGAAAMLTVLVAPAADRTTVWIRAATLGALVILVLAPYVAYVEVHQGLASYIRTGLEFSQREADRTQLHLSSLGWGDEARLFYLFHALPIAALLWLAFDVWRGRTGEVVVVAPLAALAILANVNFLRDPLAVRLPDAIVPAALVGAWLVGRSLRITGRVLRGAAIAVAALVAVAAAASVGVVGQTREQLAHTNLSLGLGHVPQLVRDRTAQLTARYAREQLDGRLSMLVGVFDFLDRCTTTRHRLLVAGNAPEVFVYAQRPFAAGHSSLVEGYYESEEEQLRMVDRVQRQVVAFALLMSDQYDDWIEAFPQLDRFLAANFRPLADIRIDAERTVRVLVHSGLPPLRVDAATGWPCYR